MASILDSTINDPRRLAVLKQLELLDSPEEAAFDRLTRLATAILHVPTALITLIDANRQFYKSAIGLDEYWAARRQSPLSHSFCKHTITTGEPLIVEDARLHPLVQDNPAIPDMNVIAYAGIPLMSNGYAIGSFCVVEPRPRIWQTDEISILKDLAAAAMTEIALRYEILERKRIEAHLRETENKYRALFDRSMDAVFIHDFTGNFIDANDAALQLLGYRREDIPGVNFASLLSPDQLPKAISVLQETLETGYQTAVSEFRLHTRDGREVYVETRSSVIYRNGIPWAIEGTARDVTHRRQMLEVIQTAYDKEKEAGELRARFMAMISHDFRTPLTIILSSSDILKTYAQRLTEEQKNNHLDRIQKQVKRLVDMLGDILTFSKVTVAEMTLNLVEIEWQTFCEELAEEAQMIAGTDHEISFSYSGDAKLGLLDEALMHRAIANLLSNAIKYSPVGTSVIFEVSCQAESITLRVQDEGIGISAEDQQHLFESFYRASNVGTIKGTGIGLTIVKAVIVAHQGSISVQSQPGQGTTFTMILPVSQVAKNKPQPAGFGAKFR